MLINGIDGSGFTKVDADTVTHDRGAIEELPNGDRIIRAVEGGNYAPEGFEGRERVERSGCVDKSADLLEGWPCENGRILEIRYEKCIGRRRGRDERRKS